MLGVQNKTPTADNKSVSDHIGASISCWKFPSFTLMSTGVRDLWNTAKDEMKNKTLVTKLCHIKMNSIY